MVYDILDNSNLYKPVVENKLIRSNINIPFIVGDGSPEIRNKFMDYCHKHNVVGLRTQTPFSYESLGIIEPLRISLYNGITLEDIDYLIKLVSKSTTSWEETEWGFPKGRRNFQEKDLECGLREFEEETGLKRDDLIILENIVPYEETFTGSNYKSYKHKYFVAVMLDDVPVSDNYQKSEVSKVAWKTYEEMIQILRPYNLEKIEMISKVNKIWSNYLLI